MIVSKNKIFAALLVSIILLNPLQSFAVEKVKKGETVEVQQDGYIFTNKEAASAWKKSQKLKIAEQEIEEYKATIKNLEAQNTIQDEQIKLAQEKALEYRKLYQDTYVAYLKERDRNDKFINNKAVWFALGSIVTVGTAAAVYSFAK